MIIPSMLPAYPDLDLDGYGDPLGEVTACDPIPNYVTNGDDCDDSEALAWTKYRNM